MSRKFKKQIKSLHNPILADFIYNKELYAQIRNNPAAILVAICLGVWFFFFNPATDERPITSNQPSTTNPIDIPPGTDGALLTLSDGKQIILDNTGNGEIAQEGEAKMIKSEDGQLVYQLSDKDHLGAKPQLNTLSTQRGKQYSIVLPDGSKVWLNSGSSITYPAVFTGNERRVSITDELCFEIAKDKSKPFRVAIATSPKDEGSHGVVEVLGTFFAINAYSDEPVITTSLVEGLVKISTGGKSSFIKPGQQARFSPLGEIERGSGEIKIINSTDLVRKATAWRNGIFSFDDDIETVMRQVARWYDVDISFQEKVNYHVVATSISRNLPISKILHLLQLTGQVKFKVEGKKIIVTR